MKNSNETIGNQTRDLPTCASTSCAGPRSCYILFSTLIIYVVLCKVEVLAYSIITVKHHNSTLL